MKDKFYSDWFGEGNTKDDIINTIEAYGKPNKIYVENKGFMAALIYKDKVICVGYDGGEYCHEFIIDEEVNL